MRLDIWLDVACLFKTRSEAQKACRGGKVDVNGQRAKPHRELQLGDGLAISRSAGVKQRVVVRGFAQRHVPKAEARMLYEDVTPAPSPEEVESRRLMKLAPAPGRERGAGAPDRRTRRILRKMKGH